MYKNNSQYIAIHVHSPMQLNFAINITDFHVDKWWTVPFTS